MALNQIPYTNVHNLNLDWVLDKLREFERRLEAIENYDAQIEDLYAKVADLKTSVSVLKNSLTALNARCTRLEDDLDRANQSMQAIYVDINRQISDIIVKYNALDAAINSLRTYNDTSNALVLAEAKQYTRDRIAALLDWLDDPDQVYVLNPWTNTHESIQQFINYLYNLLHFAGLTAAEFDALGLTASQFDSMGLTAEEFDNYGKFAMFFSDDYITSVELEEALSNYATLTDIEDFVHENDLLNYATKESVKVHNPVTGILGSIQTAINSLADLHRNGVTCTQFDSAELTASEFDTFNLTAFEFDFGSLIRFISEGLITVTTGITADQYQGIVVGAGGQLYTTII